jgi:hypothetical protein
MKLGSLLAVAPLALLGSVFACSDDDPSSTAGTKVTNEETCGSGNCACNASCSKTCDDAAVGSSGNGQGGCSLTCAAGATCLFVCATGNCTVSGQGSITVSCPKGGCTVACDGPSCEVTGCTKNCVLTCSGGATTCRSSCSDAAAGWVTTP